MRCRRSDYGDGAKRCECEQRGGVASYLPLALLLRAALHYLNAWTFYEHFLEVAPENDLNKLVISSNITC